MQAEVTVILLAMDFHIISLLLYNHTPSKYLYSLHQASGTALNPVDGNKSQSLFSRLAETTDNMG